MPFRGACDEKSYWLMPEYVLKGEDFSSFLVEMTCLSSYGGNCFEAKLLELWDDSGLKSSFQEGLSGNEFTDYL